MRLQKIFSGLGVAAMLVMASCGWDDMGDVNINPNEADVPPPSLLLTQTLTNPNLSMGGIIISTQGALYAQYLSNKQYTSNDNYQIINFATDAYYAGPLMNLRRIIELNTDEETILFAANDGDNANQIAIAKILTSWFILHMTDRWGDLPYTDALRNLDQLLPEFDAQQVIYEKAIQDLKDAVAMIVFDPEKPIRGDVLFDGDMEMWRKFANTTRLIAALRMSEVDPGTAETEFQDAFNDGVIALDNSENVIFRYLNVQTYENPYYNSFVTLGRKDWVIADPLMNWMQLDTYASPHRSWYKDGNPYKTQTGFLDVARDPRLPVYANPLENTTDEFIGMPYGLTEADAGDVESSEVSFMGDTFRQQNSPAIVYNSAQVAFVLAEGALRGWINGTSAEEYYETGIRASLEQWGVEDGYDDYMLNSAVAYDAGNALEQIITQKWIATFPNGYEAWAEWRRTGFPQLAPADNALTPDNEIPRRQAYGTNEANLNKANHAAALSRQGFAADDLTGHVWWDVD